MAITEMKDNKKKLKKKIKYASLSLSFAIVFIALVIGFNAFITVLGNTTTMKIDLTGENALYYTVSAASDEALSALADDWAVTIYFLAERENISDISIVELAEEYSRHYGEHVTVEYKDINGDPAFVQKYLDETQTTLTARHLIVQGKYHARVLSFTSLYLKDEETGEYFAFQGELRLTSAILQAGIEEAPVAVLTAGHGEMLDSLIYVDALQELSSKDIASLASEVSLVSLLSDAGFDIIALDLSKNEIPENARLVIVNDPKYDFIGYDRNNPEAVSEIDKLVDFVNDFNTLLVSVDSSTPALPNLFEYLEEKGLSFESTNQLSDPENSIVGTGGNYVLGQKAGKAGTLEYRLAQNIPSTSRLVFPNAVKLNVEEEYGTGISISSYPTAVAKGESGPYPLVALNCLAENVDGAYLYKNVILIGSTDFSSTSFVNTSYANRELLQAIFRTANTTQAAPNIPYKEFTDEALTLTAGQARTWTIIVTCVAPLIIFAAAAVIWRKRRNA